MFKLKAQLTNVRPSKTESPELSTSCTDGNMKINSPAAKMLGAVDGDFITIIPADTDEGEKLFLTYGQSGNDGKDGNAKTPQIGAKLASISGTGAGALQFSSSNAWKELKGDDSTKKIYDIGEAVEFEGKKYWPLTFNREEEKIARVRKAVNA